ncbi:DNA ligase 1 [Bombina bombina]|uniref:DNA ligase 1 n=1 Tax=Bombina bombina TaxID=8345 RepID=UPI00235AF99D|nr:DNA ligase 1 [Bombina bombina]
MQRTIKSFFQAKAGAEVKNDKVKQDPDTKKKKEESEVLAKSAPDRPLKERNGTSLHGDVESPIKRVSKKCSRALESESEEEGNEEKKTQTPIKAKNEEHLPDTDAVKETPQRTKESTLSFSTPRMNTSQDIVSPSSIQSADSPSCSDSPGISPSGIPKRRTARKQLPKRKLETSTDESNVGKEESVAQEKAKRQRRDTEEELQNTMETEESTPTVDDKLGKEAKNAESEDECTTKMETETVEQKKSSEQNPEKEQESKLGSPCLDQSVKSYKKNSKADDGNLNNKDAQKPETATPKKTLSKPVSPKSESKPRKQKTAKKDQKSPEESNKSKKVDAKENDSDEKSDDEIKKAEPVKPVKPISSFFVPRKPVVKTENKEEIISGKNVAEPSSEQSEKPKKATLGSFFGTSKSEKSEEQTEYNPSKSNYHPINDACWSNGQKYVYKSFDFHLVWVQILVF